jgi:Acyl-CoA dehydrogenase N terminal
MKSVLLSRRDLDFLLFQWLRVEELTKRKRFAARSRETFHAVLDLCEQLAGRYLAPHNKTSDVNEPTFDGEKVTRRIIVAKCRRARRSLTSLNTCTQIILPTGGPREGVFHDRSGLTLDVDAERICVSDVTTSDKCETLTR